jgi:hypothetical protein
MTLNGLTPADVYSKLLDRLVEIGADDLASEIKRTVARGAVVREQETKAFGKSSLYRAMTDEESLAIAIEFITTSCDVPFMVQSVKSTLGAQSVEWMNERPGTDRETMSLTEIEEDRTDGFEIGRDLLIDIVKIMHALKLSAPEIA